MKTISSVQGENVRSSSRVLRTSLELFSSNFHSNFRWLFLTAGTCWVRPSLLQISSGKTRSARTLSCSTDFWKKQKSILLTLYYILKYKKIFIKAFYGTYVLNTQRFAPIISIHIKPFSRVYLSKITKLSMGKLAVPLMIESVLAEYFKPSDFWPSRLWSTS